MLCAPISGVCMRNFGLYLTAGGRDKAFCFRNIVSSWRILELMIPGFGRLMQLLKGKVDGFQELVVYVRDCFSAYRQHSYECGYCDDVVVNICNSGHNFCLRRVLES